MQFGLSCGAVKTGSYRDENLQYIRFAKVRRLEEENNKVYWSAHYKKKIVNGVFEI